MWANAQRDGRPTEHRWRPLFNAAVWAEVHHIVRMCRGGMLLNKCFSNYRCMPSLRRYGPTKLGDGAEMAMFCVQYLQRAECSAFQTCILNSH